MENRVLGIVLAGGRGKRMGPLCDHRAKPALPFGPGTRLIDFSLNNIAASGVDSVAVLVDYLRDSVQQHLAVSRPAVRVLPPAHGAYLGTADAVSQWLPELVSEGLETVL